MGELSTKHWNSFISEMTSNPCFQANPEVNPSQASSRGTTCPCHDNIRPLRKISDIRTFWNEIAFVIFSHDVTFNHYDLALLASISARPQVPLLWLCLWSNIKVKNVNRQTHRRARIGNVHNSSNVALNWRTRKQKIDLIVIVACESQRGFPHGIVRVKYRHDLPYLRRYSITLKQVWRYAMVASR